MNINTIILKPKVPSLETLVINSILKEKFLENTGNFFLPRSTLGQVYHILAKLPCVYELLRSRNRYDRIELEWFSSSEASSRRVITVDLEKTSMVYYKGYVPVRLSSNQAPCYIYNPPSDNWNEHTFTGDDFFPSRNDLYISGELDLEIFKKIGYDLKYRALTRVKPLEHVRVLLHAGTCLYYPNSRWEVLDHDEEAYIINDLF